MNLFELNVPRDWIEEVDTDNVEESKYRYLTLIKPWYLYEMVIHARFTPINFMNLYSKTFYIINFQENNFLDWKI